MVDYPLINGSKIEKRILNDMTPFIWRATLLCLFCFLFTILVKIQICVNGKGSGAFQAVRE